jgi:DNA-binding IclR family transcriptional regulator
VGCSWREVLGALVRRRKAATTHEIAAAVGAEPSNVWTVLERCVLSGTVRRAGKDGRFKLYEATDGGRTVVSKK